MISNMSIQRVGAVLLVTAFVAALMHYMPVALTVLIVTGIIDIWLIYIVGDKSISYYIRSLLPRFVDYMIMFGTVGVVILMQGWFTAIWFVLGLLSSHFFEIQNRNLNKRK